jgi:hypothetical protein
VIAGSCGLQRPRRIPVVAPANASSALRSPLGSNVIPHPDHNRSWMSRKAHGALLYLSDASTYDDTSTHGPASASSEP